MSFTAHYTPIPAPTPRAGRLARLWAFVRRSFMRICTWLGFAMVMMFLSSLLMQSLVKPHGVFVHHGSVLQLDLRQVAEQGQADPLAALLGDDTIDLHTLIYALDRASTDERIKGLVADVSDMNLGPAQVEELRAAITRFRASGRFAHAYADNFGDIGPGNRPYWLASAFDTIAMQPLGTVGLTGAGMSLPFARGLLDKIGITPDIRERYEFKGAASTMTDTTLSAPLRSNYQKMIDDVHNSMMNDISAARKISRADLQKLVNTAPLLDTQAQKAGLLDELIYHDQLINKVEATMGEKKRWLDMADYISALEPPKGPVKATAALIHVDGAIVRLASDSGPTGERDVASAQELVATINKAAADDSIKAIILRINSPGGSVTASESIHRALVRAHERGKYIVVSMGEMAASGGYWIATAADRIVADPSTLTGSIGVVGGKMVIDGLSDKLGINWVDLNTGANSSMFSPARPFSGTAVTQINASLDQVYKTFLQRVMDGRNLKPAQMDALARGRVWTGVSAQKVGLVDELGGLKDAIRLVREHLQLAEGERLAIKQLPEPELSPHMIIGLLRQFISAPTFSMLTWQNLLLSLQQASAQVSQPSRALIYTGPVLAQ